MSPDQQQPNPYNQTPQQHANGQYAVVPPPVPANVTNSATGHNPYEFIFAEQPKKRRFGSGLGNDKKTMFMWVGLLLGGAVVVLIVVVVIVSALMPKGSVPGLISIAQRQQEIIRIADAATSQAVNQDVLNLAATTDLGVTSSQQQVLTYLVSHKTKPSPLILSRDKSAQTDTTLASAVSTNTYDAAVTQNLISQLQTY
jgi:hypothetical protein